MVILKRDRTHSLSDRVRSALTSCVVAHASVAVCHVTCRYDVGQAANEEVARAYPEQDIRGRTGECTEEICQHPRRAPLNDLKNVFRIW